MHRSLGIEGRTRGRTDCGCPHCAEATPGASCQDLLGVENRESADTREGAAPAAAMGV